MPGERLILDPLTEDTTNSPLHLVDPDNGITLLEHAYPPPALDSRYSSSVDVEGAVLLDNRYDNREIPLGLRVREPTDVANTNYYTNPAGELAAKWTAGTDYPVTRELGTAAIPAYTGEYRDKHAFDGSGSGDHNQILQAFTFPGAGTYALSVYVWIPSNWDGGMPVLGTAGSYVGSTETAITNADTTKRDQWQRLERRLAVVVGDLAGFLLLTDGGSYPSSAGTGIMYSDALQIELASNPSTFFSGDTIGCAWSGAHHASTSTRPATGGDRLAAMLEDVEMKVAKLSREGGTLKRYTPAADDITFDVLAAEADANFHNVYIHSRRTEVAVTLTCKPFGRGTAVLQADRSTTTLPALVWAESALKGDVPGLGKLVVDEDDADDQWWLAWGLESRFYDTADPTNKKLFYEAEALTAMSTTAAAVGASGASGGGSNVMRNTDLTPSYQAILGTQLTGGGAHQGHVGTYRVWARLYRPTGNTGAIDVALEWAEGDFRKFTRNDAVSYAADELEGVYTLADLGLVNIAKVAQGTQRWEGRVLARSTVTGDEIDVDCLMLFPVAEGYGEVRANGTQPTLTAFSARDEFNQGAAGFTATAVLPVGGTWSRITGATDDAVDYTIDTTNHWAQRVELSDANLATGRFGIAGATNYTGIGVQVDVGDTRNALTDDVNMGCFARLVDISNYLAVVMMNHPTVPGMKTLKVFKRVAGANTTLYSDTAFQIIGAGTSTARPRVRLALTVTTNGAWTLTAYYLSSTGAVLATYALATGVDSVLATGGALATGRVGLLDAYTAGVANTRKYDNFQAWALVSDAAVFASQSLELRHDRVIREDSSGAIWTPVSNYQGDYLLVPPAGPEDRQARFIVKASRSLPGEGGDNGIDDISARLTYTPRYLQVPAP